MAAKVSAEKLLRTVGLIGFVVDHYAGNFISYCKFQAAQR